MSISQHDVRFPNETPEYRSARDALLESEMELRRRIEHVAAQRRALPLGGELREDYKFDDGDGAPHQLRLSELFAPGKDTLLLYSYMYGPQMASPCVACTSILDGLDGEAPHVSQHVNLAVVAKSPIDRIRQVARDRGWRHLRLLSSAGNTYNADYHGEDAKGKQLPVLNVFARREGRVHHTYATELLFAPSEPGQDGRHVDFMWPLWNLFDVTPEGRPNWNPKLKY